MFLCWLSTACLVLLGDKIYADDNMDKGDGNNPASESKTVLYKSVEYLFVRRQRSWAMARLDCEERNMSLAHLTRDDTTRAIAGIIADMTEVQDLWIGASLDRADNQWKWYMDNSVLPGRTLEEETFPQDSYPYWAERPEKFVQKQVDHCVAINHRDLALPLFVILPCDLKKAFICEKAGHEETDTKLVVTDKFNENKYSLHVGNMTWFEGVAQCRSNNDVIATITSLYTLQRLAQKMLRVRPVIESVWLGGRFSDVHHHWQWISTGKGLDDVSADPEWIAPWYQQTAGRSGCLLLDRHLCGKPVFIADKCNKRKSVVCMTPRSFNTNIVPKRRSSGNHEEHEGPQMYEVVEEPESWNEAQSKCSKRSNKYGQGRLLTLNDARATPEFVNNLTHSLAESDSGPAHVWLGGLYDAAKDQWYWSEDNSRVYFDEATFKIGNAEFFKTVPGVEQNKAESPCLNADRENRNTLVLYGLPCNFSQSYVCYYR